MRELVLVTERAGWSGRIVRNGVLDPKPVGGPPSYWSGESGAPGAVHGYMDIALHPKFAGQRLQFISPTQQPIADEKRRVVAIAREVRWNSQALTEVRDIFVSDQGGTSRIAFGRDGTLFMTTTGNDPQNPNTLGGKVLRFRDDGGSLSRQPVSSAWPARDLEVYALGIRSSLGLALQPGHRRDVGKREWPQRR